MRLDSCAWSIIERITIYSEYSKSLNVCPTLFPVPEDWVNPTLAVEYYIAHSFLLLFIYPMTTFWMPILCQFSATLEWGSVQWYTKKGEKQVPVLQQFIKSLVYARFLCSWQCTASSLTYLLKSIKNKNNNSGYLVFSLCQKLLGTLFFIFLKICIF